MGADHRRLAGVNAMGVTSHQALPAREKRHCGENTAGVQLDEGARTRFRMTCCDSHLLRDVKWRPLKEQMYCNVAPLQ